MRGANVERKARFNFLQTYQTTNLLLCPSRTPKFNELIANHPSLAAEKAISNYEANFAIGGCDGPGGWPAETWPQLEDSAMRKPASVGCVVDLTDGGSRPVNTKDPLKCDTTKSTEQAGCWIVRDPAKDAPCVTCLTSDDPKMGRATAASQWPKQRGVCGWPRPGNEGCAVVLGRYPWLKPLQGGD